MKLSKLQSVFLFAGFFTLINVLIWLFSAQLLFQHWQSILTPCVECLSSFQKHAFRLELIFPLLLFLISSFTFLRGFAFLFKEYRELKGSLANAEINFVDESGSSAWSHGYIKPKIFINRSFWKKLSYEERCALKAHEQCHVRQKHCLQFVLLAWCKAISPFPYTSNLIENLIEHFQIESELEADAAAISQSSRKALASLLCKAIEFERQPTLYSRAGIDSFLNVRIAHLTGGASTLKSSKPGSFFFSNNVFFLTLFVGLLLIEPIQNCL